MQSQASDPTEESPQPSPARCAECDEIKADHYKAYRQGDIRTAQALTAAMGRHRWAAHP